MKFRMAMAGLLITAALPGFSQSDNLPNIYQKMVDDNKTNAIGYKILREATETIGHRLSGTENGKKAEGFLGDKLKDLGFKPERQSFELNVWQRSRVKLEVVPRRSDHFVSFDAVSLALTPVYSEISAPIVDVGNGLQTDFEKHSNRLAGTVALANLSLNPEDSNLSNLHRSEKVALALRHGAVGVMFVNNRVSGRVLLTGTASVNDRPVPIPAVCISAEDGKEIRQWMKEFPLQAELKVNNKLAEGKAHNTIATIQGKHKTEKIVIGAHWDSWDLATGAVDNGLGSMAVLEAARLLKASGIKPYRTIEFVWFMGEEQGLVGSKAYIKELKANPKALKPVAMLNCDMAGNAMGFNPMGREEWSSLLPLWMKTMQDADTGFKAVFENEASLHSDHQPFMLEGVPTIQPIANMPADVYRCYHSDCDNIELVKPEYVNLSGLRMAMLVATLAIQDTLPAKVLSSDETKSWLEAQKLKEVLKLGNDWHFDE